MKKIILYLTILFIYLFFITRVIFADSKVFINEFLIDPLPQQVELINIGSDPVDISGWILDDNGGSTYFEIPQSSIIQPNSCIIFSANLNLNKTTPDIIKLINNSVLLDSFSYKASSGSGISYQRLPDGSQDWTTGSANIGFFNAKPEESCLNNDPYPTSTPTDTPTIENELTVTPTSTVNITTTLQPTLTPLPTLQADIINIYINEIMPYPETGLNEWVELYNDNDYSVLLSNWFIDDVENGGSVAKKFSLEIPPKGFKVFNLTSSMFNNDKDSVRLLDSNKNFIDGFEYVDPIQGKTIGRTSITDDYFCNQEPTYEQPNNSCSDPTQTPTKTTSPTRTPTPTKTILIIGSISLKPSRISQRFVSDTRLKTLVDNQTKKTPIKKIETGEILGVTTERRGLNMPQLLSLTSLSYSLLTIIAVLSKMKSIYGKIKTILPILPNSE